MIFNKLKYSTVFNPTKVDITFGDQYASDLVLSVPKDVPISLIRTETDHIQSLKQLDIDSVIFGKSLVDQGDTIWVPLLLNPFFGKSNLNGIKLTIEFQGTLSSADQIVIYGNVYTHAPKELINFKHLCSGIVELKMFANNTVRFSLNGNKVNLMYFYGTYIEKNIKSIKLKDNNSEIFDLDPKAIRLNQFYRGHATDAMIIYFGEKVSSEFGLSFNDLELIVEYIGERDATINVTCYIV
jgi:hypothetical protein